MRKTLKRTVRVAPFVNSPNRARMTAIEYEKAACRAAFLKIGQNLAGRNRGCNEARSHRILRDEAEFISAKPAMARVVKEEGVVLREFA